MTCPSCGGSNVSEKTEVQEVRHGTSLKLVRVPVITCTDCDMSFTDHRAEEVKDRAMEKILRSVSGP